MIKKILSISLFSMFTVAYGQIELRVHNGGSALINGTTITVSDTLENDMNQDVPVEIDAKSIYSSSKTIRVKKYEITSTATKSENAICWGVCTIGVVWGTSPQVTSDPVTMNASQTVLYSGHVYPKLDHGNSKFRYVFFDQANPSDSTWVDVIYEVTNENMISVKETKLETSLKLFPNPATTELNVRLNSNETNKRIEVIDLLGKKVFSKNIQNSSASFRINTTNYKPGIYFVSVTSNNKAIKTEKIVITK